MANRSERRLDIIYTTMVAELLDRALDAQFDIDFDEAGLFRKRKIKGREYWYFKPSERGTAAIPDLYVGPTDDEAITRRVTNFSALKSDYQGRRKIVSTLIREARLLVPNNVLEKLSRPSGKRGCSGCGPAWLELSPIRLMAPCWAIG